MKITTQLTHAEYFSFTRKREIIHPWKINTEIEERKTVDEALQSSIEAETATREEEDAKLQTAIDTESEERKSKDEELEGKTLTEEGTEFNPNSGELTLKSAAGTNDIKVQFSFNFGEF